MIRKLFKNAVIQMPEKKYLVMLTIFVPLLNFVSGITFDLHAPSLPAIAAYFSAPVSSSKNTITISLLGFSVGCIIFGNFLDIFGRRSVILIGFMLYSLSSFCAVGSRTIDDLLWVRFIQGFSVSALSIGGRTIIMDSFKGHQFRVVMIYSSLAFSIGPVIAPFFGGLLQYHFGWKSNFIVYGAVSFILMLVFMLFVKESQIEPVKFSFIKMVGHYKVILSRNDFVFGVLVCGFSQIQLLVYTTTAPFVVEHIFHGTAVTYGNSALLVSCGYFLGSLTNRFMIKHYSATVLIQLGFLLMFISIMIQLIFSMMGIYNLSTLAMPIALICFSCGLIYMNIFTACLQKTKTAAGMVIALFTAIVLLIGAIVTGVISHVPTHSLINYFEIFFVLFILQFGIYVIFVRKYLMQEYGML
jgi:MFS family permease